MDIKLPILSVRKMVRNKNNIHFVLENGSIQHRDTGRVFELYEHEGVHVTKRKVAGPHDEPSRLGFARPGNPWSVDLVDGYAFKTAMTPEGEVAGDEAESWDKVDDANVLRDPEAQVIGAAEDNEEASAMDESSTQVPVGKPEPSQPIGAEKRAANWPALG